MFRVSCSKPPPSVPNSILRRQHHHRLLAATAAADTDNLSGRAEVIVEILMRLPVRSLLQFKSVCKSWKALISSPQFAKDHLQRRLTRDWPNLANNGIFEFFSVESPLETASASAPTNVVFFGMGVSGKHILGSCNGLLCLLFPSIKSVQLWNPCNRSASKRLKTESGYFTYHGFGYDHVHDTYKLLLVEPGRRSATKVYTFGANSWTTILDFPFHPDRWMGKFVSGTLNWIARVLGITTTTNRLVILSFDLGKETFGQACVWVS